MAPTPPLLEAKRTIKASSAGQALGAELTVLTKEQADYIDVPVGGPYKPDTYRY